MSRAKEITTHYVILSPALRAKDLPLAGEILRPDATSGFRMTGRSEGLLKKSQPQTKTSSHTVIPSENRFGLSRGIFPGVGLKPDSSPDQSIGVQNDTRGLITGRDDKRGIVICYIGAGKGKTTAGMGICIRAAGAGMNVYIMQFVKAKARSNIEDGPLHDLRSEGEWPVSCEIDYLNEVERMQGRALDTKIGRIKNEQVGLGFVGILGDKKAKELHVKAARAGLAKAAKILKSGKWEVVFLDELISALEVGLLKENDVVKLIRQKPKKVHLLLTGHNKYTKVLELCDLVTKMDMVKHPYYKGVLAQRGIDY